MAERPTVSRGLAWAVLAFKRDPIPFIGLAAVVAVIQTFMNLAAQPLVLALNDCLAAKTDGQQLACERALADSAVSSTVLIAFFFVVAYFAEIGVQRAALASSNGVKPRFAMLWRTDRVGAYIVTGLLMLVPFVVLAGIIVLLPFPLVGLVAFVIGCFAALLMILAPYFTLDRRMNPWRSVLASISVVSRNLGGAIAMVLVWLVFTLAGSAFFGLLTLVTLPFGTLFIVAMYRQFNADQLS